MATLREGSKENLATETATIASGSALSSAIDLKGRVLVGVEMPEAWTAANITMQASDDNSSFYDFYERDGTEYTITASASRYIAIQPFETANISYIKLRSGTTGTPVNQGADRTISLITRSID